MTELAIGFFILLAANIILFFVNHDLTQTVKRQKEMIEVLIFEKQELAHRLWGKNND